MFDIGFTEILVILVIGLLVIGPEKLPSTARTIGLWWGRLKYQFQAAKHDFEKEIGADDIRQQLHNEQVMQELDESKKEIQKMVSDTDSDIQHTIHQVNTDNTDSEKS